MPDDNKSPAFAYAPPAAAVPEEWLAAVLAGKRNMTERNLCLALAWCADRHGNPLHRRWFTNMMWQAVGMDSNKSLDRKRVSDTLGGLADDGWLKIKLSEPLSDGRRTYEQYTLVFPVLGRGGRS